MIPDQMVAHGAGQANVQLQQMLQAIVPLFKQAEQIVQAKMPKPQMPPNEQAALQIAQMENERKTKIDGATMQLKGQEFQSRQAELQAEDNQDQRYHHGSKPQRRRGLPLRFQLDPGRRQSLVDAHRVAPGANADGGGISTFPLEVTACAVLRSGGRKPSTVISITTRPRDVSPRNSVTPLNHPPDCKSLTRPARVA